MAGKSDTRGRLPLNLEKAVWPNFVFALLNAIVCWTAAWFFRDGYVLSATLGGFPIVVAVCAYLLVLVNKVERGD